MAVTDYIDELVSTQAFEQLRRLSEDLRAAREEMDKCVQVAAQLASELSKAGNASSFVKTMKETQVATERLAESTSRYTKTESERLNIEREIKKEGEKMTKIVESETEEIKKAIEIAEEYTYSIEQVSEALAEDQLALDKLKEKEKSLKKELKESQEQMEKGFISIDEYKRRLQDTTIALSENTQKMAELKQSISDEQMMLKTSIKLQQSLSGSYDERNHQLGIMRDAYRQMTEEERNSEVGEALRAGIQQLDDQLKSLDKSIGNNQRNVGNYEIAGKSIRATLRGIKEDLMQAKIQFAAYGEEIEKTTAKLEEIAQTDGVDSDEYKEQAEVVEDLKEKYNALMTSMNDLTEKSAEMQKVVNQTNVEVGQAAKPNAEIETYNQGLEAMGSAFELAIISAKGLGLSTDTLCETWAKVELVQKFVKSVQKLSTQLSSQGKLVTNLRLLWTKMKIAYQQAAIQQSGVATSALALTGAEGGATVATIGLKGALKGLGAAIKQIPIIGWILALVTAVAALVSNITKLKKEKTEKNANEFLESLRIEKTAADNVGESVNMFVSKLKALKKTYENTEKGSKENKIALKNLSDAMGITEQEVINLGDSLNKYIKILIEAKKAEAQLSAQEDLLKEAYKKKTDQQLLLNNLLKAHKNSYKERKIEIENLVKEFGLSEKQAQTISELSHKIYKNGLDPIEEYRKAIKEMSGDIDGRIDMLESGLDDLVMASNEAQTALSKTGVGVSNKTNNSTDEIQKMRIAAIKEIKELQAKTEEQLHKNRLDNIEIERKKEIANAKDNAEVIALINKKYDLKKENEIQDYSKKQTAYLDKLAKEVLDIYDKLNDERIRLNEDGKLTEEQITEELVNIYNERYKRTTEVINQQFADEIEAQFGCKEEELTEEQKFSQKYIAITNKRNAVIRQTEVSHFNSIQNIYKQGFDNILKGIREKYDKIAKENVLNNLKEVTESEKPLTKEEREKQNKNLQKKNLQNEVNFAQEYYDKLKNIDESKIKDKKAYQQQLLDAELAFLQAKKDLNDYEYEQEQEQAENIKSIQEGRLQAAKELADATLALGTALAENIKDEKKRVIAEQNLAMAQVMLNQAVAIANVIKDDTGDPYTKAIRIAANVAAVVASFATAMTAIQEAGQAAQQAQTYAEGTNYHKGGAAVVGEAGSPELVQYGTKSFVVDKPTYFRDLPVGAKVIPLNEFNSISNNQTNVDLRGIEARLDNIGNRALVTVNIGKNVAAYLVKGQNRMRILNTKFKA